MRFVLRLPATSCVQICQDQNKITANLSISRRWLLAYKSLHGVRYIELHGVTWSSGILLSAVVTKCWHIFRGSRSVRWTRPCILHHVTATFHMTAKNMDVTRINLLHKIWCKYTEKRPHDGYREGKEIQYFVVACEAKLPLSGRQIYSHNIGDSYPRKQIRSFWGRWKLPKGLMNCSHIEYINLS
jgi:hypothetical protein